MAAIHLSFFILLLPLAFPSTFAYETNPQPRKSEVVIEGMVYCQSCDNYGSWSLSKAKPIASAKVSVICKNQRGQVSYYKASETDGNGYFFAELQGFEMSHLLLDHPLQACVVKLVESPVEGCNLLSNINYGLYGSPLRYENKRLYRKDYDVVVYAAGPLAFRPAHCDAPTNHY